MKAIITLNYLEIASKISSLACTCDFEDSLKLMNEHFAKGEASLFLEETEIQKRLMNSFVRLSREL
jgi:hypothetical protein